MRFLLPILIVFASALLLYPRFSKPSYQYAQENAYVFNFSPKNKSFYLLDMQGNKIKSWDLKSRRVRFRPSCDFYSIRNKSDLKKRSHKLNKYNWKGKITKSFKLPGYVHHDMQIFDDGRVLVWYAQPIRTKFVNELVHETCRERKIRGDFIVEFDANGNVLWHWASFEAKELAEDLGEVICDGSEIVRTDTVYGEMVDWMHPNSLQELGDNKWYQAGDERFRPENILISSRNLNKIMIIDKKTKQVVWNYSGDELGLDHPHEAKMIAPGFPGEGNILIYDNGDIRKDSRIIEINPMRQEIVWSYGGGGQFYSRICGVQQRLKNGDTFVSSDEEGKVFIVNKEGKRVWQYSDPKVGHIRRSRIYEKGYCDRFSS